MKAFALASLIVATGSLSSLAQADYRLVSSDGSELTQLCIAAATTPDMLGARARTLGISMPDLDTVRCNGMMLQRFVGKYGNIEAGMPEISAYKLTKSDSSPVTELCVASTRSEQEFEKVKDLYFSEDNNVEAEVLCNGLPLKTFARRYRTTARSISQR